ncbi:uncharacterized protein LOC117918265 [Vitis riparia]|uniref:uncharacterized protein LOC117918265 n=1 Tax=Vitis riparia TaxID=96939 RepID=UPI00155A689D|nr:uncharacterized protein LOC117918265 [Vitis riparia]
MVQRKVGNKLGIQADHVSKTEKRLGNLKPGFSQHQDGRNRAADMKKKMKKSRSIKLSDIESLRSSPLQPDKPPPLSAQPAAAKQSVIRPPDGSPNYMKSTSCSDARKESSQVSPRSPQTGSGSGRRLSSNSKVCSASTHRTARTSSLKLVKTLTKSPSFKPVRASTKKCSKVALCADMDAHGATCSSTLKDSNFPEYLMLNPGGTEYEGTSVIKVCPYTYCSLNGHHHAPLPPLKCFLSARRRVLKTQKTMKLEALSPRRAKLPGDGMKSIDTAQVIIDGKPAIQEVDSGSSAVSPLIQEVGMDFFIEIYAKNRDDSAEAIGSNIPDQDDKEIVDVAGETGHLNDIMPSVEDGDETTKDDGQLADSESDEPPVSEIDSGDNLDQNSDVVFAETSSERDQRAEEADEDYPPSLAPGEITPGYSSDGWESKSEATDMDWEEGQFSAQHPDNSTQGNDESNLGSGYLAEIKHPDLHDEPTSKPDDIISKCFEEIFSEVQQEVIEDESSCFEVQFSDSDSDSDSIDQNLENDESSQMSESPNEEQISSIFKEVATHEDEDGKAGISDFFSIHIDSSPVEEAIDEPVAANNEKSGVSEAGSLILEMYPQLGDVEATGDIEIADKPMIDQQESGFLQDDDANVQLKNQGSDSSQDFVLEQELINGGDEGGKEEKEQADSVADNCKSSQAFSEESLLAETQDHPCDNNVEDKIDSKEDKAQAGKFKITSSMDSEEHGDSKMKKSALAENSDGEVDNMEVEDITEPEAADTRLSSNNTTNSEVRTAFFPARRNTNQELVTTSNKPKGAIRRRRPVKDNEEPRSFNPREPNYLPLEPDPEAEKVDLRHQMMDERKNSEEWMLDFALRKTVTELAPARKRKVALLVEAFETVLPLPKYETRIRHTSAAFAHPRPIQACS